MRLPDIATPRRYEIELTVDPDLERFTGEVKIELEMKRESSLIWLNAEQLQISSAVLVADKRSYPARAELVGNDFVALHFAEPLPMGAAIVTLKYSGKLAGNETEGIFRQKEGGDWYALTQFEAISARRAFPCFDEPHWKTPWQLALTVKPGDFAFSNTPVLEERATADGMKRVLFAETAPLPTYLVAFGVGPFDVLDGGVAGMRTTPLRYITPKGRAHEARYAKQATPKMLEALEKYFGIPYPYQKLDSMVVPVTVGFGAMENVGLITYSSRLLLATPEHETDQFKQDYLAVGTHEIAHQWFGDLVTAAWWDDIWLNESFATWLSDKVVDQLHPEWQWSVAKVQGRRRAMDTDRLKSTRTVRQEVKSRDDLGNAFDRITYDKGGAVLTMYESWLGETAFRDGVRRYLKQHEWGNATAQDFFAALAVADPQVAEGFASFVGQPGLPLVDFELDCSTRRPAVVLRQQRFLPARPDTLPAGAQRWAVPACLRYDGQAGNKPFASVVHCLCEAP